jgi:tetratricopeptide (TPR) repeat protein
MRLRLSLAIAAAGLTLVVACGASKELTKAKEFIDAGMFDQAIVLLKQEVQANPKSAEAHMLLGAAYLGNGTTALAEQELNTATILDDGIKQEASKRCYEVATHLVKTNKADAHIALTKAKEYDPALEKDEQFFFLTNIDTEESEPSRMEAAKRYVVLFPSGQNSAQVTYQLAEGLLESGDREQAKTYFTQVVKASPSTEWGVKASDRLAHWADTIKPINPTPPTSTPNCVVSYPSGSCWTINPSSVQACPPLSPRQHSVTINQDGSAGTIVVSGDAAQGVRAADSSGHQFLLRRGDWFEIQAEGTIRISNDLCGGPEGIRGWYDSYVDSPSNKA